MALNNVRASNHRLLLPYNATQMNLSSADFCLSVWLKYEAPSHNAFTTFIGRWQSGNLSFVLAKDATQNLRFGYSTTGLNQTLIITSGIISQDTIYNIIFQRLGNTGTFFINNVADATTVNFTGVTIFDSGNGLSLGQQQVATTGTNVFDGLLWDFRIYLRALSTAERAIVLESKGSDGITNSLVGRYRINEGSENSIISTAIDISTTGNHASSTNSPTYTAVPEKI